MNKVFDTLPSQDKRYKRELKFYERFGEWGVNASVRGEQNAVHFHCSQYTRDGEITYSSGIEIHRKVPASYQVDTPPSQEECVFISGPCWHDGTSLGAETAEQFFLSNRYAALFSELESWLERHSHEVDE